MSSLHQIICQIAGNLLYVTSHIHILGPPMNHNDFHEIPLLAIQSDKPVSSAMRIFPYFVTAISFRSP